MTKTFLTTILLLNTISPVSANTSTDSLLNGQRKLVNIFAGLAFNSASIKTSESNTTSTNESSLTTTGTTICADYFFKERFSLTGAYFISVVTDIDSEIEGLDIGVKYYYLGGGYKHMASIFGNIVKTSPSLSPYVYLGYNTTKFQFSNYSVNFKGLKLETGLDWHFSQKLFARTNIFMQSSANSSQRTMSNFGVTFGIGASF
jgi:hypothetical protein